MKFFSAPNINPCQLTNDISIISNCLNNSLSLLAPMFTNEIRSMSLPILDPYIARNVRVIGQNSFLISVQGMITHAKVRGIKDFVAEDVLFDPKKLYFYGAIRLPKLYIVADYDVLGRLLLFSLPSVGKIHINPG